MADFPIIEKLGGRAEVARLLSVRPNALHMATARGRLPGRTMLLLMRQAEERGLQYAARDFDLPEQPQA